VRDTGLGLYRPVPMSNGINSTGRALIVRDEIGSKRHQVPRSTPRGQEKRSVCDAICQCYDRDIDISAEIIRCQQCWGER